MVHFFFYSFHYCAFALPSTPPLSTLSTPLLSFPSSLSSTPSFSSYYLCIACSSAPRLANSTPLTACLASKSSRWRVARYVGLQMHRSNVLASLDVSKTQRVRPIEMHVPRWGVSSSATGRSCAIIMNPLKNTLTTSLDALGIAKTAISKGWLQR